jgi:allantoinase
MIIDSFNVLYRESAATGLVMPISLHPFLIGTPHRIDALNRSLEYVTRYDDVWLATGGEIFDHYMASGVAS